MSKIGKVYALDPSNGNGKDPVYVKVLSKTGSTAYEVRVLNPETLPKTYIDGTPMKLTWDMHRSHLKDEVLEWPIPKSKKNKKKTICVKVKVKSNGKKTLPDWGLGPGVLAEQEVVLLEPVTQQNQIHYNLTINNIYDTLVENTVEPVFEEKQNSKSKRPGSQVGTRTFKAYNDKASVTIKDDSETQKKVYEAVVAFLQMYNRFVGESIAQDEDCQLFACHLIADIADKILESKIKWQN